MTNFISLFAGSLKFVIGWLGVLLIRLIPFRPPNFEPMTAVIMPYSKRYGAVGTFAFAFLGIGVFDLMTSGVGIWTLVTGVAYGLVGIAARYFFRNRDGNIRNFVMFGAVGTILYDAATGLTIGPLFFNQPFMEALIGQIPFTAMHLLGTITFSVALSPILYRWVVKNEVLELPVLLRRLRESY